MLELYKGQIDIDKLKYGLSYKEALLLRDVRVERYKREREETEKEHAVQAEQQRREQARSKIILP